MPNDPDDTMSVFIPTKPDRLADTPDLSTTYCPVCEPVQEPKAIVRPLLCDRHNLAPEGDADDLVTLLGYLSGTSESGGEDNRIMNNLIARRDHESQAIDMQTPGRTQVAQTQPEE